MYYGVQCSMTGFSETVVSVREQTRRMSVLYTDTAYAWHSTRVLPYALITQCATLHSRAVFGPMHPADSLINTLVMTTKTSKRCGLERVIRRRHRKGVCNKARPWRGDCTPATAVHPSRPITFWRGDNIVCVSPRQLYIIVTPRV